MTSELELETIYTARLEMSRAHSGWMISRSRGNIVLWLCLALHAALEECLETNRVAEFPYAPYYYRHLRCVTREESVISYGARCTKLKERFSDPCASEVSPLNNSVCITLPSTTRNVSIAEQLQQSKVMAIPQHQNPLLVYATPNNSQKAISESK